MTSIKKRLCLGLIGSLWLCVAVCAQTRVNLRVSVTRSNPQLITIKSAAVPLSQIAAQLSAQLKVPIQVSPLLRKQTLDLEIEGWTLESVARQLAPVVYADSVTTTDGKAPRLLALYLQGVNEPLPQVEASLPRAASIVLIEGSTEDDSSNGPSDDRGEVDEKQPLSVAYRQGLIALHAKAQPLRTVLETVASRLGVACDARQASTESVTLTVMPSSPVELLRKLSERLSLYLRHDWQNGDQQILRIVANP